MIPFVSPNISSDSSKGLSILGNFSPPMPNPTSLFSYLYARPSPSYSSSLFTTGSTKVLTGNKTSLWLKKNSILVESLRLSFIWSNECIHRNRHMRHNTNVSIAIWNRCTFSSLVYNLPNILRIDHCWYLLWQIKPEL